MALKAALLWVKIGLPNSRIEDRHLREPAVKNRNDMIEAKGLLLSAKAIEKQKMLFGAGRFLSSGNSMHHSIEFHITRGIATEGCYDENEGRLRPYRRSTALLRVFRLNHPAGANGMIAANSSSNARKN